MKVRIPVIPSPRMQAKSSAPVYPIVEVANQYNGFAYDFSKLEYFFETVFSVHQHGLSGELSVVFMDETSHSDLHGKFLQDYRPTDVITFPADTENGMAGEICVSVDRAKHEACIRNLPFCEELSLYLIHGWLHLVGFDDLEKVDREVMRLEEQKVMELVKKLGALPDFRLAPNLS